MSPLDDDLELTTAQVKNLISDPSCPAVIDVREEWELARGILPGAVHMPLSRFREFLPELQAGRDYIIYCEHGVRSLDVAAWLRANTTVQARSMSGGFAVWDGPTESWANDVK